MKLSGNSIYKLDSGISGPRLMILGGVHGNEMTGISVVKELLCSFSSEERKLINGSLILALGNLRAIEKRTRGSVPHADMNRVFIKEKLVDPANYEEFRASELAPFMASSDILIDIHSTNKPSRPFAIAKDANPARIELAKLFPTEDYVISPPKVINGTTDVWVTENGGFGLGYESGMASDITKVPETLASIDRVMVHLGMMEKTGPEFGYQSFGLRISELKDIMIMPEEGFEFSSGKGLGSFEEFRKGETLGVSGGKEIKAEYDGLLMFPKLKEHQKVGAPVGFLATLVILAKTEI